MQSWTRFCPAAFVLTVMIVSFPHAASAKASTKPLAGYDAVTVERFTVEQGRSTKALPAGYEWVLQTSILGALFNSELFDEVIDGTLEQANPAAGIDLPKSEGREQPRSSTIARKLNLSGRIVEYSPGSRSARLGIGMGAGAAKMKVLFIFRDSQTGREVFRTERTGRFIGMDTSMGGTVEHARVQAATDIVNGLIQDVSKNR